MAEKLGCLLPFMADSYTIEMRHGPYGVLQVVNHYVGTRCGRSAEGHS